MVTNPEEDPIVVRRLSPESRPTWSEVTSAGIFRLEPGHRFDRHFHDCDEYWLVFDGRAKVVVGSRTYTVERGDIVCTETGVEHDVESVDGVLEAFWFEDRTPPGGRIGHLHRTDEDARGHVVRQLDDEDPG